MRTSDSIAQPSTCSILTKRTSGFMITEESRPVISSLPLALVFSMFTSLDAMQVIVYTRVSNLKEL